MFAVRIKCIVREISRTGWEILPACSKHATGNSGVQQARKIFGRANRAGPALSHEVVCYTQV